MTAFECHDAEQALLGALLQAPAIVKRADYLRADHFYRPGHSAVFTAILEALDTPGDHVVDEVAVLTAVRRRGDLDRVGGAPYLHELVMACPTVANVDFYAMQVVEAARRRALFALGQRLQQVAGGSDFDDVKDNASRCAEEVLGACRPVSVERERLDGLHEWGAFVDEDLEPFDWLIPGLLERMDRVIVVASEGVGKSTLARQMALALSAGVHPFNATSIRPRRTLVVDLENSPRLVRRKGGELVGLLRAQGKWASDRAYLWSQPGGIDLRRPTDVLAFDEVLEETRPALVCFGPLYKAFVEADLKAEQVNREVAAVLDRMRAKHRVALWLEHHAPMEQNGKRSLRPFGSGVWSRWPEFGLSLYKDRDSDPSGNTLAVQRFRGDRDERSWPDWIVRDLPWPWRGVWKDAA